MVTGNFSGNGDYNATIPKISEATLQALGIFTCLIIVIGIPGNVLVILSVCVTKSLRTAANWLVVSLSVCDFLFDFLVLPFQAFSLITGRQLIPEYCWTIGFLANWFLGTSILSTGAIALNRYIAIVLQNKYRYFSGNKAVIITFAFVYVFPFALLTPMFNRMFGTFLYDPVDRLCNWWEADIIKSVLIVFSVIIPLVLMTVCYLRILLYVIASRKRVGAIGQTSNGHGQQQRSEGKLSRMLAMVYIVYMITTLPSFSMNILEQMGVTFSRSSFAAAFNLVWSSSAINPIVYGLVNKNYRNAYKKIATKMTLPFFKTETQATNTR